MLRIPVFFFVVAGCGSKPDESDTSARAAPSHADDGLPWDTGPADSGDVESLAGFIGSPCDTDADCAVEGGVCVKEGLH